MAFHYSRQRGVSVFEMAIGLCVAATLGLGALHAQAMVERATARSLAGELREVKYMVALYRERYKATPGDDRRAHLNVPGAVSSTLSEGDSRINGSPAATWLGTDGIDAQHESGLFWQHLRLARLASGDASKGHAFNAVRGRLGVGSRADMPTRPLGIGGLNNACSSMIDGKLAHLLDLELDDGDATSGTVWAAIEVNDRAVTSASAPSPYVTGKTYTVCMAI